MTSQLQPMDKGIIKKFKFYCGERINLKVVQSLENNCAISDVNLMDSISMDNQRDFQLKNKSARTK